MLNARPVFTFLAEEGAREKPAALVSIMQVTGASTRNPGALMGVSADGRWCGSFSGGCIEAAVAGEALQAIAQGKPREVRFGAGSPYIDIRLPCGGGIDLLFTPLPDGRFAAEALRLLDARQPLTLTLPRQNGRMLAEAGPAERSVSIGPDHVTVRHLPQLRLMILGQGAAVEALAAQGQAFGADVHVLTPEAEKAAALSRAGVTVHRLKAHGPSPLLVSDPWTATAFLFHDHDWEADLLAQALAQPGFYIGAMGSRATHERRCEGLAARGLAPDAIARIVAPIGLIGSSRDPEVLALSTLTQIVERFERI